MHIVQMATQLLEEHRMNCLELIENMIGKNEGDFVIPGNLGNQLSLRALCVCCICTMTVEVDLTSEPLIRRKYRPHIILDEEVKTHEFIVFDPALEDDREGDFNFWFRHVCRRPSMAFVAHTRQPASRLMPKMFAELGKQILGLVGVVDNLLRIIE